MNDPKTSSEPSPGHYGAGYGEQVPDGAPPQPAPAADADRAETATAAPLDAGTDTTGTAGSSTQGDGSAPVVFTPDDVSARPPDHPPTENAPESEKAALIFERS